MHRVPLKEHLQFYLLTNKKWKIILSKTFLNVILINHLKNHISIILMSRWLILLNNTQVTTANFACLLSILWTFFVGITTKLIVNSFVKYAYKIANVFSHSNISILMVNWQLITKKESTQAKTSSCFIIHIASFAKQGFMT